jgi:hypothetical protein
MLLSEPLLSHQAHDLGKHQLIGEVAAIGKLEMTAAHLAPQCSPAANR